MRSHLFSRIGILLMLLATMEWGCSSQPECSKGYSQISVYSDGRPCQTNCDCNNQVSEGFCVDKKCVSLPRISCETNRSGEVAECILSERLIKASPSLSDCKNPFRVCQEEGLQEKKWGDCKCVKCPKECPKGQSCIRGKCQCPEGKTLCGTACVDIQSNTQHCGGCSKACEIAGSYCAQGTCQCPQGQTVCEGRCVSLSQDSAHCGTCGQACQAGQECKNSTCVEVQCLKDKNCSLIPNGRYLMGSAPKDNIQGREKQHEVLLTRSFYLWNTEVTQKQFKDLMGYNPATVPSCGEQCPAETVTWHEAAAFANALSSAQKREECFTCLGRGNSVQCTLKLKFTGQSGQTYYDCPGWRLPTEGEWEYAARAGSQKTRPDNVKDFAWYKENSGRTLHPVAQKTPNPFGLYDTLGNVLEWTFDGFSTFDEQPVVDPVIYLVGPGRVLKGANAVADIKDLRFAFRGGIDPLKTDNAIGFRITRTAFGKQTLSCQGSRCQCKDTLTLCQGYCADLNTNPQHCGRCENTCTTGTCKNGTCVGCPQSKTDCNGTCVDLQSSNTHCGSCEKACPQGQQCTNGTCGCSQGKNLCQGSCVNLQSSNAHCGSCGKVCPQGQQCTQGLCKCPQGKTDCNGACVDLNTNPSHCGSCGNNCNGTTCKSGTCQSSGGCKQGDKKACQTGQKGVCNVGSQICQSNGTWGACQPNQTASPEVCDNQDNDCNGVVDDNPAQVGKVCNVQGKQGPCAVSKFQCSSGALTCPQTVQPKTEVCNNIDDDCNGTIDNGLSCTSKYTVSTVAGSGVFGFKNGPAASAQFRSPGDLVVDKTGNIFVADAGNSQIRKIDTSGNVTTFAGSSSGFADGTGGAARFSFPYGIDIDAQGNLYIADTNNHRVRKVTPQGVVTTLAGTGKPGFKDGPAATAQFNRLSDVAVDSAGNVYVSDTSNQRIRKIDTKGVVSTVAGSGTQGFKDGAAASAQFFNPNGLAIGPSGNLYIADTANSRVRKLDFTKGTITTLAGRNITGFQDGPVASARFNQPLKIVVDKTGTIFIADHTNNRIRKLSTQGIVSTLAGDGTYGDKDGDALKAQFKNPQSIVIGPKGHFYVIETGGHRVRKISP